MLSKIVNPKILIVGPSWVGDMVMTQSLCHALRQRYPNVSIDILAPRWSEPIIARMPGVNEAIGHDLGHGKFNLADRMQIAKKLQLKKYDQAIVIPGSWKSALIPWLAKIPIRTGYRREMRYGLLNDIHKLDKKKLPLMVQRLVSLAWPKASDTQDRLAVINPKLKVHDTIGVMLRYNLANKGGQSILALCPGAEFGSAKMWPADHYAMLATEKLALGWQVWLFGSAQDSVVAQEINSKCQDQCTNLAGKTTLSDAVDLLSMADLVVANDSGLMHVACALGCNVVAIYGSTSPSFAPPLSARSKVVTLHLDCQPCRQRECPLKHHKCMEDLTPEVVSKEANELM